MARLADDLCTYPSSPLPIPLHTTCPHFRAATWAWLADDLCMYPSPEMIRLVDKKFGGELNKADVMGVEVWG